MWITRTPRYVRMWTTFEASWIALSAPKYGADPLIGGRTAPGRGYPRPGPLLDRQGAQRNQIGRSRGCGQHDSHPPRQAWHLEQAEGQPMRRKLVMIPAVELATAGNSAHF